MTFWTALFRGNELEAPTTRHRSVLLLENGVPHQVPRPDFEHGDEIHFGSTIPAGWQIRPTLSSDIPLGFAHSTKPFILLRKFPGLLTYREFINLPGVRQRSKNLSAHGDWAWRRLCRKDPRKAPYIASVEVRHRGLIAKGDAWPEGEPDQWPEGTVTKWLGAGK